MKSYILVTTLKPTCLKTITTLTITTFQKSQDYMTKCYYCTDVEETERLLPMGETDTSTKKRYIKTNPVYPKGKCFNLISFIMD